MLEGFTGNTACNPAFLYFTSLISASLFTVHSLTAVSELHISSSSVMEPPLFTVPWVCLCYKQIHQLHLLLPPVNMCVWLTILRIATSSVWSAVSFRLKRQSPHRADLTCCQKAREQQHHMYTQLNQSAVENSVFRAAGWRLISDVFVLLQRQDRLGSTSLHLTRTHSYLQTPDTNLMLHSQAVGITASRACDSRTAGRGNW